MRDIKRRKSSIESTGQITKAMKLVSTVKLQKARSRTENAKPYFNEMYNTVVSMMSRQTTSTSKYLQKPESDKKAVIVITSNRGLAGGYNMNVVKLLTKEENFAADKTKVYAIGQKGSELLKSRGYEVNSEYLDVIEEPLYSDAMKIAESVLEKFVAGEIGEIYMAYTEFKNTVSQVPKMLKLLPVDRIELTTQEKNIPMNYEPEESEALEQIIPKYISSLVYGALLEAQASENGARMTAMDSATGNAEEMIDKLSLEFNRARQGSITQELTEIIAGAEAIS
jgi:F-type H+-transporting ATPase subunit gamma